MSGESTDSGVVSLSRCTRFSMLLLGGWSGVWLEAMLAFAAAARLYLVTEELLIEAHEIPETPLATAIFFAASLKVTS